MPSKSKPLTDAELTAYGTKRDLAADLLRSVREMKAGQVRVVPSPVIEARNKTGLSQSQFAALMGVSVRTLQGWEQGRKQPRGGPDAVGNCKFEPEGIVGGGAQIEHLHTTWQSICVRRKMQLLYTS